MTQRKISRHKIAKDQEITSENKRHSKKKQDCSVRTTRIESHIKALEVRTRHTFFVTPEMANSNYSTNNKQRHSIIWSLEFIIKNEKVT